MARLRRRSSKVKAFLAAFSWAERVVPFPPDVVWPLFVDPAMWRPGGFVHGFDVTEGPADLGPLRMLFWRDKDGATHSTPFRVTTNEPLRRLVLRYAGPEPLEWTFDLRAKPTRRGTRLQIRTRWRGVGLRHRMRTQRHWDRQLSGWLHGLALVLTGQWERPGGVLSAEQAVALACPRPSDRSAVEAVAEVDIRAPADVVWQVVWDPRTVVGTDRPRHAGHAPGTPTDAVGEIQYVIREHEGHLVSSALVVTAFDRGRSVTTSSLARPAEVDDVIEPSPDDGCTRLRLTERCWYDIDQADLQRHCEDAAESFKRSIEATAR